MKMKHCSYYKQIMRIDENETIVVIAVQIMRIDENETL